MTLVQSGLVSVIMPCYNGERWLREAIESCLAQTYKQTEIIVIDDGSTDGSLEIIKSFGIQIDFETGPNKGSSASRNRGFALSHGEFIQYLDADDYLLPTKIEEQVRFLRDTGADSVYGDWRHQYHHADGEMSLGEVDRPGLPDDLLEALLGPRWWVPVMTLLHRRRVVEAVDGWDESLQEMDDFDFLLSVILHGCDVRYLAGLGSVYRVYGRSTLSRSSPQRLCDSTRVILEKVESQLVREHRFTRRYREALALRYFALSRRYYEIDPLEHSSLLKKTFELSPTFKPDETALYSFVQKNLGIGTAERLAMVKRRLAKRLSR